ncbi:TetR/AcrR family transcriptional regulator [Streptomyces sp. NBC_00344]|uniref:TetR/AcrR family transcriptional regulator n=1 Tax=Streptomyces sp. NBC_00344 TaxID=2975720 RepID=UPI002E20A2BF
MSSTRPPSKDPRGVRTRARLREALLDACEEQPLEQVSASEVVRRAGVGRATFYLHYDDLHALALDACAAPARDAVEALHTWDTLPPEPGSPPAALLGLLESVYGRAGVYRSLLRPGGGGPLGELLHTELMERSLHERRLRRDGGEADVRIACAVAAAFTALLADWVHDRVPGTPAELAGHIWRLLVALHMTA